MPCLVLAVACGNGQPITQVRDGGTSLPPPDAGSGTDAGNDAGTDMGSDGGTDGGSDAGTDGGTDAGTDEDAGTPEPYTLAPLQTQVPHYELTIPEATLQKFSADPYTEEQPGQFKFDGRTYNVLVRLRGGSSRFFPKRSWRVELPDGVSIEGRRKLNLVAEMCDRTLMVEKLGYDLLEAAGADGPRASYVQLFLNGADQGVYVDIERVDKKFTKRVGYSDPDPTLYRSGNQDSELKLFTAPYQAPWEKETNETVPGMADLEAFLQLVNRGAEPTFVQDMERTFQLDQYLRVMAVDALISMDIMSDAGIYMIHNQLTDVWQLITWDYNNSASRFWPTYALGSNPYTQRPIPAFTVDDPRVEFFYNQRNAGRPEYLPAFNTLATRIVRNPQLRQRYLAHLEEALDQLFTEEQLHPRIDAMHRLISPLVATDPYVNMDTEGMADPDGLAKFSESAVYLKKYVTGRIAFLRAEIRRMRAETLGLGFDRVDANQGTLRLKNFGTTEVELAGLVLTTDLRRAKDLQPNLPARTLAPGESVDLNAAELGLQLSPSGELGIFTSGRLWGPSDIFFYGRLAAGAVYQRDEGGEHPWRVQ
ncbi:MAG: CotH kinase family protein [Myxococcota bacterium]|nr:CotH kinase family protein [Myxococcota bacterium]